MSRSVKKIALSDNKSPSVSAPGLREFVSTSMFLLVDYTNSNALKTWFENNGLTMVITGQRQDVRSVIFTASLKSVR
jgi:hypothetical protein